MPNFLKNIYLNINPWTFIVLIFGIFIAFPIVTIIILSLSPSNNIWQHLLSTVLPTYIKNTLILFLSVGILTTIIGTLTAWFVVMYEFPLKKYLTWMLLLPLAMPTYIIAYTYTNLFEYSGPIQIFLRQYFDFQGINIFPIRSMPGAAFVMSFVLYPYIYITAKSGFLEISPSMLESSKLFNRSQIYTFMKVAVPLTRPAIIVGLTLVLLEVLNDFGTVDYFAIKTFSIGVYDVWFNMGNLSGAAQIAFIALIFVFFLVFLERYERRKQRFYQTNERFKNITPQILSKTKSSIVAAFCLLPVIIGFVIPALTLLYYSIENFEQSWRIELFEYIKNSFVLAITASLITIFVALILVYARFMYDNKFTQFFTRLSITGYALPGIVLAIGIFYPFTHIDHFLNSTFSNNLGLLLSGSIFILIFAYVFRFITVAIGSIESSFQRITPSMDMTARTLGYSKNQILLKFYLPLLKTGLLSALLLVFVDTMKELPATLFLRPFNFNTLSTFVYQYASDERLEQCAIGALIIVLSGVLPIILLNNSLTKARELKKM